MHKDMETLISLGTIGVALVVFSLIVTAPEKNPGPASIARRRAVLAACSFPTVASILPLLIIVFQLSREAIYQISASIDLVLIWLAVYLTVQQPKSLTSTIQNMLSGKYSTAYIWMLFTSVQVLLIICFLPLGETYTVTLYVFSIALSLLLGGHFFLKLAIYPVKL